MTNTATSLEQFGILRQIAQLFKRERALNLDSCHHYDLVVCPTRAVSLLREFQEQLHYIGAVANDAVVLETLLKAGEDTKVHLYIEIRDYLVLQILGYDLLFAACAPKTSIKAANVKCSHDRPYYC